MNTQKKNAPLTALLALSVVGALTLGACAPRVDARGNEIHPEQVEQVEVGVYTRANVMDTLGSPSAQSTFGEETWYYISEVTETTAFLAPELRQRRVVVVKFNPSGLVSAIDTVDENSAEVVQPADGATPTAGNSLGFFEQMLANIGRFNKKK
ncbi:outer membrane protein assembly factor BamE [Pseudomonadota bacterium]